MKSGSGLAAPYSIRLRMPKNLDNPKRFAVESGGWDNLPVCAAPITSEVEKSIIQAIINDLGEKQAMVLSTDICVSRAVQDTSTPVASGMMIVGSSKATRLASALEEAGHKVSAVTSANWRAIKSSVERLSQNMREKIQEVNPESVVLFLMDNSIFYSRWDGGSMVPARKGNDGHYHVDSELVITPKETQINVFNLISELLETAKGRRRVVVMPMLRYVSDSCCEDSEHVSNRGEAGFVAKLKEELEALKQNFRDFLFLKGFRDTIVFDPSISTRNMASSEIWGCTQKWKYTPSCPLT